MAIGLSGTRSEFLFSSSLCIIIYYCIRKKIAFKGLINLSFRNIIEEMNNIIEEGRKK